MTEAMPFLQKAILLSYAPRPFAGGYLLLFSEDLIQSLQHILRFEGLI